MVDSDTYYRIEKPDLMPKLAQLSDGVPRGIPQCLCRICLKYNTSADKRKKSKFSEYDDIRVERTHELTAHQYLLCSESVPAYVMKARSWRK